MPLEFKGRALMDPPGRGVRFAGYPMHTRSSALVICQISVEALREIGRMPDANPEEVVRIFENFKDSIHRTASGIYDLGDLRPTITAADVRAIAR
jgi:hypothetical protein